MVPARLPGFGLLVLCGLASTAGAGAQVPPASTGGATSACADPGTPRVAVRFTGDSWTAPFRNAILRELHAALAAQDMAACDADLVLAEKAVARIELRTLGLPRVAVVIEVEDEVTDKRVARDLDLASFPEDGRALALAVASDELLRASWMELAIADAPEPARPPPPAVRRTVEAEVERSRPRRTTLALRGTGWLYAAGETHLGADLIVAHRFSRWASIELSVGARVGLEKRSDNGTVQARVLGGGTELRLHPWTGDTTAGVSVGLLAQQVVFHAEAFEGSTADTADGLLLQAVAGVFVDQRLGGPVVLHGSVGLGAPLMGVAAHDDGQRVSGAAGVAGFVRLGLGVEL